MTRQEGQPANLQFQWVPAVLTSMGFQGILLCFHSACLLKLGWVDFCLMQWDDTKHTNTSTTSIKACDTTPVRSSGSQSPLNSLFSFSHVFCKAKIRKILFPSSLCSWGPGLQPRLSLSGTCMVEFKNDHCEEIGLVWGTGSAGESGWWHGFRLSGALVVAKLHFRVAMALARGALVTSEWFRAVAQTFGFSSLVTVMLSSKSAWARFWNVPA